MDYIVCLVNPDDEIERSVSPVDHFVFSMFNEKALSLGKTRKSKETQGEKDGETTTSQQGEPDESQEATEIKQK